MRNIYYLLVTTILLATLSCNKPVIKKKETQLFPVEANDRYGYIDRKGRVVIDLRYSKVYSFNEGIAPVAIGGDPLTWGLIGTDGHYILPATYKYATLFNNGIAFVVAPNEAPKAVDSNGKVKFSLPDAEHVKIFSDGLAAVSTLKQNGEEWGFIDKTGATKIATQYNNTGNFSEGLCAVRNKDHKWGYIDHSGSLVINYQFDLADDFSFHMAKVHIGDKWGVINRNGKYIVNPIYQQVLPDNENMIMVFHNDLFGWVDTTGKTLINPRFTKAAPFAENDIAPARIGDKYGFIDRAGKVVINSQFDYAYSFDGDLAVVSTGDKVGFINREGKYMINPQYDGIAEDYFRPLTGGDNSSISVQTDINSPGHIAYCWSKAIGSLNFDLAKTMSAESILSKLDVAKNVFSRYSEEERKAIAYATLGLLSVDEKGDDATVILANIDLGGQGNIRLHKFDGKWKVIANSTVN